MHGRTDQQTHLRQTFGAFGDSNAEVEQLDGAIVGNHDVGRLDVAVHHAAPVRIVETAQHLNTILQHLCQGHLHAPASRPQVFAAHQLHHHHQLLAVVKGVVQAGDVGMVQRGKQAHLAQKTLRHLAGAGLLRQQHLQCLGPLRDDVRSLVHSAETAAAQRPDDLVVLHALAWRKEHGCDDTFQRQGAACHGTGTTSTNRTDTGTCWRSHVFTGSNCISR